MNICLCFYLDKEYNQSIPLKLLSTFMNINNPQFVIMLKNINFDGMGIVIDNHSETIDACIQNTMTQKQQLKYNWCIIINVLKEKVEEDFNFIEYILKFISVIKLGDNSIADFYSTANGVLYAISSKFSFMHSKVEKDIILG